MQRLARRGIALDPHGGWSRLILSGALWAEGKTDSALSEARRAWQDDSLFTIMSVYYVSLLIGTGHLDSAAAMIPRVRAILSPTDADPLEGMLLGARRDWRGAVRLLGWRYYGGCYDAGMYVRALLALGDTVAARATVDSMVSARTPGYYNPVALAALYGEAARSATQAASADGATQAAVVEQPLAPLVLAPQAALSAAPAPARTARPALPPGRPRRARDPGPRSLLPGPGPRPAPPCSFSVGPPAPVIPACR